MVTNGSAFWRIMWFLTISLIRISPVLKPVLKLLVVAVFMLIVLPKDDSNVFIKNLAEYLPR